MLLISPPVFNKKNSLEAVSMVTKAKLSLGIAFRKLPPLTSEIFKP